MLLKIDEVIKVVSIKNYFYILKIILYIMIFGYVNKV